ncbi:MAG: glycosyltransferase [Gemmataceae bacterium]
MNPSTLSRPVAQSVSPPSTLAGADIICFSHDWNSDPLSRNHLMRLFARDNRILWVNSIGFRSPSFTNKSDLGRIFRKLKSFTTPLREVEHNIFVLNPLSLPWHHRPTVRRLNRWLLRARVRRAMNQLGMRSPLVWITNPMAGIMARQLGEKQLIYYCVDENAQFQGISPAIVEMEQYVMRQADCVIVTSDKLLQSKQSYNPNTKLLRHGVDLRHFGRALAPQTPVADEVARLPRPVIGFFGLVADWVDVELLADVARAYPHGSVVLLGKIATDVSMLANLPNVHLLGQKPYAQLPEYCKGFDVALLPFRVNELTLNANPLKVREYLAAGLPVVATPLPEVEIIESVFIGRDRSEFRQQIQLALAEPGPRPWRVTAVRQDSWEARFAEVCGYLRSLEQHA